MAGMLPGVECARRRRLHKSGAFSDSSNSSARRSSFCLYATNHESHLYSSSSLQRSIVYELNPDHENMIGAAREAKQRLDDKFKSQRVSEIKRQEESSIKKGLEDLQIEVYGSKKNGGWKFSWRKMRWKESEEEDCAVCLESFKIGETLTTLPCAHRFHSKCLKPWLLNNSHCPCCRTTILITL